MKLYVAILEQVPDNMVPVLVAHAVLGAHLKAVSNPQYLEWLDLSFKKCIVSVNEKEFNKLKPLAIHLAYESTVLEGKESCAVILSQSPPCNTLKFARLWKPKDKLAESA